MKTRNLRLAVLVLVASTALIGCGNEVSTAPAMDDRSLESSSSRSAASLFKACEANAIATLSLADVVKLTPFLNGTKTMENATLGEIVAVTPAVGNFQEAFRAEIGALSLGDIVKVTTYMSGAGKNRFPYPELDGGPDLPA